MYNGTDDPGQKKLGFDYFVAGIEKLAACYKSESNSMIKDVLKKTVVSYT